MIIWTELSYNILSKVQQSPAQTGPNVVEKQKIQTSCFSSVKTATPRRAFEIWWNGDFMLCVCTHGELLSKQPLSPSNSTTTTTTHSHKHMPWKNKDVPLKTFQNKFSAAKIILLTKSDRLFIWCRAVKRAVVSFTLHINSLTQSKLLLFLCQLHIWREFDVLSLSPGR